MAGWMTRRWAIDCCKQFFGLSDNDEAQIRGEPGRQFLQQLWDTAPDTFYEHPLAILRQEWFHAADQRYAHAGFWATLSPQARVLDYGCGTGEVARLPWIARGRAMHLCEPSRACGAYLRHKFAAFPRVRIMEGAAHFGRYDALICTDVLEHVPNPLEVQEYLWTLLKPGGHALLKFESAYPHPGHLVESIAQIRAWMQWMNDHSDLIEIETYAWARKPL